MKTTIIGAGHVGSTSAFLIATKEISDVFLIDIVEGLAKGTALDMMESSPILGFSSRIFGSDDLDDLEGSDIVVITAGFARKPGITRSDLLLKNAEIVGPLAGRIARLAPAAKVIVVTNPLDAMTHLTLQRSGFEPARVIGMSGALDSARFRYFISEELSVSPASVSAQVIASHSELMMPLSRLAAVSGTPLKDLLGQKEMDGLAERTKRGGAEVVSYLKTKSAFYAPAASVAQMVQMIAKDEKGLLSASVMLQGEYGIEGICLGVPIILGAAGVEKIVELDLNEEERYSLKLAADEVRQAVIELGATFQ
ncbi:MAG: malate dehydrogenase [Actinomycetota bacterium]|nr:malate dehydrogenase [Actinomycetota bacterium]